MARFRIRSTDGHHRVVAAHSLRRDGERLQFCGPRRGGSPRPVAAVPAASVVSVRRRIIELNGMERWIDEPIPDVSGGGADGGER